MALGTPKSRRVRYEVGNLREFCTEVFLLCGVPRVDAIEAANVLSTADLWGITSHGVARLRAYFELLREGRINPEPDIRITRENAVTARIDGGNGLGLVLGAKAIDIAVDKARRSGMGWVSVANSNHFGIAGYYAARASEYDTIGCAMTNTSALVSPFDGIGRMLGTNPLAVAFPVAEGRPLIIDLATSAISYGAVEKAARRSVRLPTGVALDRRGAGTRIAKEMQRGGSLLPLGGDHSHGGHKGYCLAAMIDIFCGVLSGANWGPFVPPFLVEPQNEAGSKGAGLGHLFGAANVSCFLDPPEFKSRISEWMEYFRSCQPRSGKKAVMVPGDPERIAEAKHRKEGICLHQMVCADLNYVAESVGIKFRWQPSTS